MDGPTEQPAPHRRPDSGSLWAEYAACPDLDHRNRLVLVYSPLVKWVVGRLSPELRRRADAEDLVSYGIVGLIDAVERFDAGPGYKFETYAVRRIRGAIIDQLRRLDTLPRQVRDRGRKLARVRSTLEHSLGRHPTREELAAAAGLTVASLDELEGHLAAVPVSLDAARDGAEPGFDDEALDAVVAQLDDAAMSQRLREAVSRLPERERAVITLYYLEGLRLAEVGEVLGVTDSRVSQLRSRAVAQLRLLLDAGPLVAAG